MRTRPPWVLLMSALLTAGCGVCGQITQHRETFESGYMETSAATDAPTAHLRLTIPKDHIEGWERRALATLPPSAMSIPGLGDLGRHLGNLELKPRKVRLQAVEEGVRVGVDLDVRRAGKTLFGLELTAMAPTRYDARRGRLTVDVRADLFESVKPRIRGDAVRGISDGIKDALPKAMKLMVPRKQIDRIAKKTVEHLITDAYKQLRGAVLTKLGRLTSFGITIPRLPLAGLTLRTHDGHWLVDIQGDFEARGLGSPLKVRQGRIRLDVSAFAMARLGNWAMDEGHLPARYTEEGRATSSGAYRAGLVWAAQGRPVKVHLWTANPDDAAVCVRVMAGGQARLSYKKSALEVGFTDVQIEEAVGPPLFESALNVLGITERVFNYTKTIALDSRLKLGERETNYALDDAEIRGDVVTFELRPAARTHP